MAQGSPENLASTQLMCQSCTFLSACAWRLAWSCVIFQLRIEHVDSRAFAFDPGSRWVAAAVPFLEGVCRLVHVLKAVATFIAIVLEADNQASREHEGLQPAQL